MMTSQTPFAQDEYPIVVDVETAGPNPGSYSLLSIGACTLAEPQHNFYVELKPDSKAFEKQALDVSHLSIEKLSKKGTSPREALQQFADWVDKVLPTGAVPIFSAFNAPFDWMFVNDYFHRYLGRNPFGYKALDIKAFYMGQHGTTWADTSLHKICQRYNCRLELPHHALEDAIESAALFRTILAQAVET
jgi:ribonuclease T